MHASDFRARARRALKGKWPAAVLAGLAAGILGGAGEGNSFSTNLWMSLQQLSFIFPELGEWMSDSFSPIGVFAYATVALLLGSPVRLGYIRYHLKLADGQQASIGDLFSCLGKMVDAVLLRLWSWSLTAVWSMLFAIPGIMAFYSYAMAPYIMAEDPNCLPLEAISRSKAMMKGHKMELFKLELSYYGWGMLSVMTLGLGYLLLVPYTSGGKAAFYRELKSRQQPAEEPVTQE